MKAPRAFGQASLAALILLALANSGCGTTAVEATARAASAGAAQAPRVIVAKPQRMTVRRITEQPGQIEAVEVTPMHAKLAGYVASVRVDIGERVKAGQVLAELRVPEVAADLKQKAAMIEQAEAEKTQAEATVEFARAGVLSAEAKVAEVQTGTRRAEADVARWKAEYARIEQLFRERAQTGSLLDETKNKLNAAEATEEEVKAKVKSAEAALAEAKAMAGKARAAVATAVAHVKVARFEADRANAMESYTRIVAPYDAIVIRRKVDTGELTTPGATGDPLFVVARSDIVTISVGVPESEAPFVNVGDAAQVRLVALDGRTFDGKVTRTAWALDAATRTLLTEIDLPSQGDTLRPGLYAYATIIAEEHKDALTVPATAIVKDGGKAFCIVVVDKRAKRKPVQVGLTEGKRTEILSGLGDGDEVVEANGASLADGQPVEPIQPPDVAPKPKS